MKTIHFLSLSLSLALSRSLLLSLARSLSLLLSLALSLSLIPYSDREVVTGVW